ncbi:MAG: dynamin family protein [Cyanobacteria bacterium J06642_2]
MTYTLDTQSFLKDLDRVARVRQEMSAALGTIANTLDEAERDGQIASGQFGLERDIEDLHSASKNLRQGVFRLLVLGDMKRGKSTFLNALIGENLLPSDVNPCTALLTILKYGPEKKVTVHFNDNTPPETVDFKSFKHRYTIDPAEAKELETQKKLAFPNVSHAVVEYPLPMLEKGIEIVDSPGLNDTEARNELSLGYINNCHAILFVLRASQPCTLGERRYLENYIKGRGLSVFFLINAWDQVKESLIDPDNEEELSEAAGRLRKVFQANLSDYCRVDGYDIYDERVFEISALEALRRRVRDANADLSGTGFPEFTRSLNTFLTQERAIAEFRQARTLARQARNRVSESVERRIPLLDRDVTDLKQRITSVQPEFEKLVGIRDTFRDEIRYTRDSKSRTISDSVSTFVMGLEHSFENDFLRYQPELGVLDALNPNRRKEFETRLQNAFEQYVNDQFSAWTLTAEQSMNEAFKQLSASAAKHGTSYLQVTERITEMLTGRKISTHRVDAEGESSPAWANWAMGLASLATGNPAGLMLAAAGFDWKSIILNLFLAGGLSALLLTLFPFLGGAALLAFVGTSAGLGLMQADQARKELVKAAKKELVKHLPRIAQEQRQPVFDAVQECFNVYEREVMQRIDDDIQARKNELDNLLAQKESREIDRDAELNRLQQFVATVDRANQDVETAYQSLLVAAA